MSAKTLPIGKNIVGAATELAAKIKTAATARRKDAAAIKENAELDKIKSELRAVRRDINTITSQFNEAGEPECVAYYAYLLKANEAKYDYLLRRARECEACRAEAAEQI